MASEKETNIDKRAALAHELDQICVLCGPISSSQDKSDADELLAPANVDYEALCQYAQDAAHFSTGGKLPDLQFAQNHAGQKDVAMFDFTCMHRAENASMVRERKGKKLLIALVGDCLVEVWFYLYLLNHFYICF